MSQQLIAGSRLTAWLLVRSGPLAGTRFPIPDGTTRIGRAPDNDAVVTGGEAATVSSYHCEISREAGACRIRDLGSTNGTWLNGERVTEAEIPAGAALQLGNQGPEFSLVWEETPAELDRTIEIPASALPSKPAEAAVPAAHEAMLSAAVARARRMRAHGVGGQTLTIMRDVVEQALRHSRRRLRVVGFSLLAALCTVSAFGAWRIRALNQQKRVIDAHIRQLETEVEKSNEAGETDRLLARLDDYQGEAESLQRSLLFRIGGAREPNDFVTRELRSLMAEFGAEVYTLPPDFVERVKHYIDQDLGQDRPVLARALGEAAGRIERIRALLQEEQLPPDLAYIPIVESAVTSNEVSGAGAVGPWQMTAPTAKAYGLRVDGQVDERKELVKSTRASCRYLRDLILDFGTGSSVLLALAAYNSGPGKVKQAVIKNVRDPIKQRNFWYLYRARALPLETREYVPKVCAAIVIGRNPAHFGF